MSLCQYKDILGEPGKGFHNHFGFGFAILDLIGTIIIAYIISKKYKYEFGEVFMGLMLLAIFLHKIFCVDTVLNKFIFG